MSVDGEEILGKALGKKVMFESHLFLKSGKKEMDDLAVYSKYLKQQTRII